MLTPSDLVGLPGVLRHLHPSLVKLFIDTAGRLASNWLADQSDVNLSHILGLIKVGLAPAMRHGHAAAATRLAQYPNVALPGKPTPDSRPVDRIKTACSLVEAGFIGKAERALNDQSRVAPINEETINILKSKHPSGPVNPFDVSLGYVDQR